MYTEKIKAHEIIEIIGKLKPDKKDTLFIMLAEKNNTDLELLVELLNNKNYIFFGGIFPGLIYANKKYETGAIISKIELASKPYLVEGLNNNNIILPSFNEFKDTTSPLTAIVLVDGLTSNISNFISGLFDRFGNSVHYLGGGAGSLSLIQKPCLFTNDGVYQDAAVISILESKSNLTVKHGWEYIKGPFVATKTEKNIIKELNWENAFTVYKKVVEEDSGEEINSENFFNIAKGYPFGISRDEDEYIVRDPIAVNEKNELICVGEVPENSILDILKGKSESLINAAKFAIEKFSYPNENIKNVFVFDCISRVLFLEEDFEKEIDNVYTAIPKINKRVIPEGVLSLGEISSYQGYLEFFNKTIVIGLIE